MRWHSYLKAATARERKTASRRNIHFLHVSSIPYDHKVYAGSTMISSISSSVPKSLPVIVCLFHIIQLSHGATLGSPNDSAMQAFVQACLTDSTRFDEYGGAPGFGFGQCPWMINCMLLNMTEANKAGMSAGTSIAALIPTMLALMGRFLRFNHATF